MSVELISVLVAILAIGASLAGLILTSNFDAMENQFGELRERMVHLGGLLEGCANPSLAGLRPTNATASQGCPFGAGLANRCRSSARKAARGKPP